MRNLTIGIIGCGNMGSVIARGIREKNITNCNNVLLNDKDTRKCEKLANDGFGTKTELIKLVRDADILIIAVKPQDSNSLFKTIQGSLNHQAVVSVMAGVNISDILKNAGKDLTIARIMPNLAAFVGESMTCVAYKNRSSKVKDIENILSGIGKVLEVKEEFLDGITALAGSGPAYLFYLADAMIEAGRELGLEENVAREIVIQTLYGSAFLMKKNVISAVPSELAKKVASKGGTTEAALAVLEEKNMKAIIKSAIEKAKKRSEELSRG